MKIESDRTLIRNFTLNDLDDLQEILGDEEVMKNCEPPYGKEKTAVFLRDFCIGRKGALACIHKESDKVIGYILFTEYETDVYEIGWFFNRKYWRCGYAYEVCSALMRYAFVEMNVHKIFAETVDPEKSVGLMKKLGMELEEVQERTNGNLYLYAIGNKIKLVAPSRDYCDDILAFRRN